jgi:hypothetical protein
MKFDELTDVAMLIANGPESRMQERGVEGLKGALCHGCSENHGQPEFTLTGTAPVQVLAD